MRLTVGRGTSRHAARPARPAQGAARSVPRLHAAAICVLAAIVFARDGAAALPREVARAFLDAGIPLTGVSAYVREIGKPQPSYAQQAAKPMNPASTMKLVTTFAALDLLHPDFHWRTEIYGTGRLDQDVLEGDLVIRGSGDPKITLEQFEALIGKLRASGVTTIRGDLVLDRGAFALAEHDPAAFDAEPTKPYNVGPDALLLNFKSVRLVFAPNEQTRAIEVRMEPPLANVALRAPPAWADGDCGDWKGGLRTSIANRADAAEIRFGGPYAASCGEREWYLAALDHPHYALALFSRYWAQAGGRFSGRVREGRVPPGARLLATLDSPPLYDVVRDINKLSNNVMARQLFLTLASVGQAPPATTAKANAVVNAWLRRKKLHFPELVLENGSGLSRRERIAAQSMGKLLISADESAVRSDFATSLAVAATDGTVRKRFADDAVADHAFLKTGSLEGVRAVAGYVYGARQRRFVVVCFVNHPNAAAAQPALDLLVERVYREAVEKAR